MVETHHSDGSERVEEGIEKPLHREHHTTPKVLVIGTETAVFDRNSPVRERILAYTKAFGETHLIVMCRGNFKTEQVGSVTFHPTNSPTRLLYGTQALLVARRLPKPDVVTAQDPHDSGMLGLWIARMKGAALHVQVHADVFAPSFASHSVLNMLRSHVAHYVLKRADGIRVVSESIKTSIEKRLVPKRSIAVLPIFIDIERFASAQPGELAQKFSHFKTKLLWVGRFEPEKNAALALKAFASAPTDACLILLGKGSEEPSLREQAAQLGVQERVFFEGMRDPAPYYALAELLLVTSDYEGYSRVIIEALAAGKPVLSTDVGIARASGALITDAAVYAEKLCAWFAEGTRTGKLRSYPYRDFDEYVRKYCDDIISCVTWQ